MVEIDHIGAMATYDARAAEMLGYSAEGVAHHSLFCLVAIEVVDANIVVGRLDEYEVVAANREAHFVLLVENLNVGLLEYGLVAFNLLAEFFQLAHLVSQDKDDVAQGVWDEHHECCVDK